MGYLFAILGLFSGLIKAFCGKKISAFSKKLTELSALTFVRMFFCIVLGFIVVLITQKSFEAFTIDKKTLMIAFFCGLATSVFLVSWLLAVQNGAYMLLEIFLTLGVLIPLIFSAIFFQEKIVWLKWVGVALLAVAAYVMNAYSTKIKGKKTSKIGYVFLIVCCLGNGFTQFTQKWFSQISMDRAEVNLPVCDASTFSFYAYIFAFALLCIFVLCLRFAENHKATISQLKTMENKEIEAKSVQTGQMQTRQNGGIYAVIQRAWVFIFIMSACLFANSYFTTRAADYLSASELYPLQQGLSLVFSVLMSAIFFKEPITKTCLLGIFITFLALLTINVFPAFL